MKQAMTPKRPDFQVEGEHEKNRGGQEVGGALEGNPLKHKSTLLPRANGRLTCKSNARAHDKKDERGRR